MDKLQFFIFLLAVLLANLCNLLLCNYRIYFSSFSILNIAAVWHITHAHRHACARAHTHTHKCNGPFPGLPRWAATRKVKAISEWQWHQLGDMQVCTSLQIDNHASTPPLSFLQAGCPSCRAINSINRRWQTAAILNKTVKSPCLCNLLPDFDDVLHNDAHWTLIVDPSLQFRSFENPRRWRRPPSL